MKEEDKRERKKNCQKMVSSTYWMVLVCNTIAMWNRNKRIGGGFWPLGCF